MPRLKGLHCQVEWDSPNHTPFHEYKTTYGDGFVLCYIAIPLSPTNFVIRLKSNGYIAPGLAMFVYIDGEYQCNRNRNNLLIPAEGVNEKDSEIDFRVRQKECSGQDGTWTAKQWQFQKATEGKRSRFPDASDLLTRSTKLQILEAAKTAMLLALGNTVARLRSSYCVASIPA